MVKKKITKKTKKKLRSGGIVSSMVDVDSILKKSRILAPFITAGNTINENYIDSFIYKRIENAINNIGNPQNEPLTLKIQDIISNHLEMALKSERNNKLIEDFIKNKIKNLSHDTYLRYKDN
tara:strand:+ start:701 stop:1066 length:366 start_codon:yes stop_codon:yes gene_type:complete